MTREITTHHTNPFNKLLTLEADERDEANGNASHHYVIIAPQDSNLADWHLDFQQGPGRTAGVNGITNEVLLAIVIDRLEGFQSGKHACDANAQALSHCAFALASLESRTRDRMQRGVEGTHNL